MSSVHKVAKRSSRRRANDIRIPRDPAYTAFGKPNQAPLAQRLRTTLKYSETVQRTGTFVYDYVWRLNSIFDPNLTGVGHQPKGFDQLAALYQRYRVYHAKYDVIMYNTTSAIPAHFIIVPTNSSSTYTDASDAIEAPMSEHTLTTIYQMGRLRGSIDLATLNGKSHAAYAADDTTQALVSTNPTETLNLHVVSEATDGSTTLVVYYIVEIYYDVEFSDPVQLGQS